MPSLIAAALFAAPLLLGAPSASAPVDFAPDVRVASDVRFASQPGVDVAALEASPQAPTPLDSLGVDGDLDAELGDGDACVAWAGTLSLRGCAATDAADPTSSLWPELTAAVELTHDDIAVAVEVLDRLALDDDDLVARAVVTFTF